MIRWLNPDSSMNGHLHLKYALLFLLVISLACTDKQRDIDREHDVLIAEAYDERLYLSDIDIELPETFSSKDSQEVIRSYAERWVRDKLLLVEAGNKLENDQEIKTMVKDYEYSLLLHTYEELLINNLLDTVITREDLKTYFRSEKNQFILDNTLYRIQFLLLQVDDPRYTTLRKWWSTGTSSEVDSIRKYCATPTCQFMQTDSSWIPKEMISRAFPSNIDWETRMGNENTYTYWADNTRYMIRILEKALPGEIAPLQTVEKRLRSLILHDRKRKLLMDVKNDLYKRAVENNRLKMHL